MGPTPLQSFPMSLLRAVTVLFPLALAVPVAYAQTDMANPALTAHAGHIESSDDLLADPQARGALSRVPWATTASAGSDLISAAPQAQFVFADEAPLQAGMFDSPTAWEDEP